ncbi:MAG: M23 family metallopeptidase [Weeksellaceae bacterium]
MIVERVIPHLTRGILAQQQVPEVDYTAMQDLDHVYKFLVNTDSSPTFLPTIIHKDFIPCIQRIRSEGTNLEPEEKIDSFFNQNKNWITVVSGRGSHDNKVEAFKQSYNDLVMKEPITSTAAKASTLIAGITFGSQLDETLNKWEEQTLQAKQLAIVHLKDLISLRLSVQATARRMRDIQIKESPSQRQQLMQDFRQGTEIAFAQTLGYSNLLYLLAKDWIKTYNPPVNDVTATELTERKRQYTQDIETVLKFGTNIHFEQSIDRFYNDKKRGINWRRILVAGVVAASAGIAAFGHQADTQAIPTVEPRTGALTPQQPGARARSEILTMVDGLFVEPQIATAEPVIESAPEALVQTEPVFIASDSEIEQSRLIMQRYGSELYPSVDAMPEELREYFLSRVNQIAAYFNVKPGLLIGIMQAENNNAGLRIYQPALSTASAAGVGQFIPETWNGWNGPIDTAHSHNMNTIMTQGGNGFDWFMRDQWQACKAGDSTACAILNNSNADPQIFENSVAAIARHFVSQQVTVDIAETDPLTYFTSARDAIAIYNSGKPYEIAMDYVQSAENHNTTGDYVAWVLTHDGASASIGQSGEAAATAVSAIGQNETTVETVAPVELTLAQQVDTQFIQEFDSFFATRIPDNELQDWKDDYGMFYADVEAGKITPTQAAEQMMSQVISDYLYAGQTAVEAGQEPAWPHIWNNESYIVQMNAARQLGHVLPYSELKSLLDAHQNNVTTIAQVLNARPDAQFFLGARIQFDQLLGRSSNGQAVLNADVWSQLSGLLAGHTSQTLSDRTVQMQIMNQFFTQIKNSAEYLSQHPAEITDGRFQANPLLPMDSSINRGFGAEINYQTGGKHTGIDVAADLQPDGSEPILYAVNDGTVTYVGPLYCDVAGLCRGDDAIVIDHGNNVYSIYSHNSEHSVSIGQTVTAGQPIGRQGNEGYSFGSHLHFEVHTGAPYSGDWTEPFAYGQFEDPLQWLPIN